MYREQLCFSASADFLASVASSTTIPIYRANKIAIMSDSIAIYDRRMLSIIDPNAKLEKLAEGAKHTEGVVYCPEDDSDVIGDRLMRWSVAEGVRVIHESAYYYHNGNDRDLAGRLVSCSHGKRAIVRQEVSGEWETICDRYLDKRLNSPNDLTVKSDGTIWFTDPPFGLTQPLEGCSGQQEQAGSFVYRLDVDTGAIEAVIKEMERPTLDNNLMLAVSLWDNGDKGLARMYPRNGFVSQRYRL